MLVVIKVWNEINTCLYTLYKQMFSLPILKPSFTLEHMLVHVCDQLKQARNEGKQGRIGMTSGSINADGPAYKQRNIKKLVDFARLIEKKVRFPVFCAPYFFTDKMYKYFEKQNSTYDDYMFFWRKVLQRGIITDIFMMYGWERSIGARDEYNTAKKCNIMIHIESA